MLPSVVLTVFFLFVSWPVGVLFVSLLAVAVRGWHGSVSQVRIDDDGLAIQKADGGRQRYAWSEVRAVRVERTHGGQTILVLELLRREQPVRIRIGQWLTGYPAVIDELERRRKILDSVRAYDSTP